MSDLEARQRSVVDSFFGVIAAPDDAEVLARADEALAALDTELTERD